MSDKFYCPKDCEAHKREGKCYLLERKLSTQDNPNLEICWEYYKPLNFKKSASNSCEAMFLD